MPQGIARAALSLGMGAKVSMFGCRTPKALEWKYPNVREALDTLGVDIGSGTPALAKNERMVVAVGIGLVGLHRALYRPDKTYMDPAFAKNTSWGLWTQGQLGVPRSWDTGIYSVVSHGDTV
ncbi:MAG: hypothetical protein AAF334_10755 [Pseudomonadota bacterium]